ncbi:hypothetical protein C8R46DRAFT_1294187 [Mycena filopes]|nr:hypothetical protein C8R46DRAFT_1294187 [Mycena filopes]
MVYCRQISTLPPLSVANLVAAGSSRSNDKSCGSGNKQGRFMLQCFNQHNDGEPLFHFFAAGDTPAPAIATRPMEQVAQRPQPQRQNTSKLDLRCPVKHCGKNKHAVTKPAELIALIPHRPSCSPLRRQYAAMLPAYLDRVHREEQQAQDAQAAALAQITSPSPSPERSLIQEWRSLEFTMQLSLSSPSPPPHFACYVVVLPPAPYCLILLPPCPPAIARPPLWLRIVESLQSSSGPSRSTGQTRDTRKYGGKKAQKGTFPLPPVAPVSIQPPPLLPSLHLNTILS